ncbi:hypothetical protein FGG08_006423 [Glutinoglossum americanum]|uniref:Uncharacterized protein n=1 Tax=Glutinoglossum americanum TaxID=1670608 RepID=A0A9P8L0D7_9PEZI|nr:hypothetical protein FGG08_006423 [Glutinoglossum americanum]
MAPLTLPDNRSTPQPESQTLQSSHGPVAAPFRTVSPHAASASSNGTPRDSYHHRQPSLGEIHQELEQEQEAQVQQQQLQQAQQASGLLSSNPGYSAVDDSTPTSERSFSFPPGQLTTTVTNPRPRSPTPQGQSHVSADLSRQSSRRSRTSSRGASSPSLLPLSAGLGFHSDGSEHGWVLGGSRDESAFYQAETQMLTRENQMLRQRIRELERQVNELNVNTPSPTAPSNPTAAPSASQDRTHAAGAGPSTSVAAGEEEGKE